MHAKRGVCLYNKQKVNFFTSSWTSRQSSIPISMYESSTKQHVDNSLPANISFEPTPLTNCPLLDNRVFIEDVNVESIDQSDGGRNGSLNYHIDVQTIGCSTPTNHQPKRATKRRLNYPGDVREDEDLTPRSSKKFIRNLKATVTKQRLKLKNLYQKKRRATKRISSLKSLVSVLKQRNLVTENALESLKVLRKCFSVIVVSATTSFKKIISSFSVRFLS